MGNPNPEYITDAMWRLQDAFMTAIPGTEQLSGIYANKRGYHNTRKANPVWDYSRIKLHDLKGPNDKSAAFDITFPEAHGGDYRRIQETTKILFAAVKRRDPRLYHNGVPIFREFLGNVGGRARGIDLYTLKENDRDSSHEWHIHGSVTREFVDNWELLKGVIEVLKGSKASGGIMFVERGDKGEEVEYWQLLLSRVGVKLTVDGDYGAATAKAVSDFYKTVPGTSPWDGHRITHRVAVALQERAFAGKPGPKGDKGDAGETPSLNGIRLIIDGSARVVE